jgi:hypothetical protein
MMIARPGCRGFGRPYAAAQYQQAIPAKQLGGEINRYRLYSGADQIGEAR